MPASERQPTTSPLEQNRLQAIANLERRIQMLEQSKLYGFQRPVYPKLLQFFQSGETAGTIVLPTGGGKTVIASEIIETLGLNTVMVSPTGEILDKTKETIEEHTGLSVTNYDGRSKNVFGKVINTTLPSLEKLAEIPAVAERVELMVVDENDFGTLGRQRHALWRKFPNALFVGLTATPDFSLLDELKERGLISFEERWTGMFTKQIHKMTLEEAEKAEAITPLDIHLLKTNTVFGEIKVTKGEYDERELERMLNIEARNLQIIALLAGVNKLPPSLKLTGEKLIELHQLHQRIKDKQTVVFCISIKQAEELEAALKKVGVEAYAVHGQMSRVKQKALLEGHRRGLARIILGVDLIGRGFDSPSTEVGIFARPRRGDSALIQEVGRIRRTSRKTGKKRAFAIQLVDNTEGAASPLLIPEVVDYDYVLKGQRTLAKNSTSSSGERGQRESMITVSGMDIEAVQEIAVQGRMKKIIESASSLKELNDIFDTIIATVREGHEIGSVLDFYRQLNHLMPSRVSVDIQKMALDGITNPDPSQQEITKKWGEKVYLLLNLKSIFKVVEKYFTANEANNEEIFQTALIQVLEHLPTIKAEIGPQQINGMLQRGEVLTTASELNMLPKKWVADGNSSLLTEVIDEELMHRQDLSDEGLSGREKTTFAHQLANETGYDQKKLGEVIVYRNTHMFGEVDDQESDIRIATSIDYFLREKLEEILNKLSEREAGVIRLRYGWNTDSGKGATLDEIGTVYGVTGGRIQKIESGAMAKLRQYSRSLGLSDLLDNEH